MRVYAVHPTHSISKKCRSCVFLSINICMIWIDLCRWLPSFFTHQLGKIWLPVSTSTWAQNGSSHRSPLHPMQLRLWLTSLPEVCWIKLILIFGDESNQEFNMLWFIHFSTRNQSKLLIQFGSHHKKRIEQKPSAIRPKPHLPHQNFTVALHVTDATFQLPIREKITWRFWLSKFSIKQKNTGGVYW